MKSGLDHFAGTGGSGIVMGNCTLVCPLMGANRTNHPFFMIVYSTGNGSSWVLSEGVSPADCLGPLITEWESGQIFMIVHCERSQRVFESRDMGKRWTEARGKLSGVWGELRSGVSWDGTLCVGALITATIEGVKVMLCTHKASHPLEASEHNALYLWVTDNNRSFHFGPLSVNSTWNEALANTLLYSDGNFYIAQEKYMATHRGIPLARLTEELSTIKSVLSTWAQLNAFFFKSSIPTTGLVGFLSNSANGETWIDDYRCVNATVTKAAKVKNGFHSTGPNSGATWLVNIREDDNHYGLVNYDFTLVATVAIHQAPNGSSFLQGAVLGDSKSKKFIGLT
ncbi:trans-sialidase [Trypanosoma cruzi Dm28c]|uniref:Trans-sialidase n=1 Tax=Trypanosoma cruzi Dm28c TaxID=1416333 RepID=V5A2F8_TRYCR|nr:trans-sialidase [Trypanosoma cruzi Dm28c]